MASFDTFSVDGDAPAVTRSFDEGGYGGEFDSYTAFSSADTPPYSGGGFPGGYGEEEVTVESVENSDLFGFGGDQGPTQGYSPAAPFGDSPAPISNGNGKPYDLGDDSEGIFSSDGPVLPPPNEMQEEGFALREWRRQNAIRLEEKEKLEKEVRNQILEEAEEFKRAFYEKRKVNIESNKTNNREKEKVYLEGQEKFHKEVDKHYWKAVGELIPNEVANIQKRGKKEQEKKPSITVVQGPKPGKPTDLSRMRHILVKLKHNPPPHMIPPPPAKDAKTGKDGKDGKSAKAKDKDGKDAEATTNGPVAVEAAGASTKDAVTNGTPPATTGEEPAAAAAAPAPAPAPSDKPAE